MFKSERSLLTFRYIQIYTELLLVIKSSQRNGPTKQNKILFLFTFLTIDFYVIITDVTILIASSIHVYCKPYIPPCLFSILTIRLTSYV